MNEKKHTSHQNFQELERVRGIWNEVDAETTAKRENIAELKKKLEEADE